jgi:hypothetical protein
MRIAPPLRIVTIPSADVTFARTAAEAVDVARGSPRTFETMLRRHYPAAIVRRRDISDEFETVWYVYRDGWALHGA